MHEKQVCTSIHLSFKMEAERHAPPPAPSPLPPFQGSFLNQSFMQILRTETHTDENVEPRYRNMMLLMLNLRTPLVRGPFPPQTPTTAAVTQTSVDENTRSHLHIMCFSR